MGIIERSILAFVLVAAGGALHAAEIDELKPLSSKDLRTGDILLEMAPPSDSLSPLEQLNEGLPHAALLIPGTMAGKPDHEWCHLDSPPALSSCEWKHNYLVVRPLAPLPDSFAGVVAQLLERGWEFDSGFSTDIFLADPDSMRARLERSDGAAFRFSCAELPHAVWSMALGRLLFDGEDPWDIARRVGRMSRPRQQLLIDELVVRYRFPTADSERLRRELDRYLSAPPWRRSLALWWRRQIHNDPADDTLVPGTYMEVARSRPEVLQILGAIRSSLR